MCERFEASAEPLEAGSMEGAQPTQERRRRIDDRSIRGNGALNGTSQRTKRRKRGTKGAERWARPNEFAREALDDTKRFAHRKKRGTIE
jgi:hypothetical protein